MTSPTHAKGTGELPRLEMGAGREVAVMQCRNPQGRPRGLWADIHRGLFSRRLFTLVKGSISLEKRVGRAAGGWYRWWSLGSSSWACNIKCGLAVWNRGKVQLLEAETNN